MAKGKNKNKKGLVLAGVAAGALVVGIVIYAAIRALFDFSDDESVSRVSVSSAGSVVNKQVETQAYTLDAARVDTTVEIQMDDFAAVVGTQVKVAALVSPANTSVSWSTSNASVFTVTNEGVVVIRGKGSAVLTATAGNVSDSILIEGIESVASGSTNDLPIYTASNGDVSYVYSSDTDGDGIEETVIDIDLSTITESDDQNQTITIDTGTDGDSDVVNDGNSYLTGTGSSSLLTGNSGYDSTNVGEVLSEQGFDQAMSNVYVYTDDNGKYYGEIVTQPGAAIIYIKETGSEFDNKVKNVIASMIPDSYEQVWNTFKTANTDKSFVADGKKVRIVIAQDGGHSQIVIYN